MDDSTRIWITAVPSLDPDDVGVLLSVDTTSESPGERMVSVLLNRGHEGEEGVFHLLPFDLSARYARDGDRLTVTVTASRQVLADDLADDLADGRDGLYEHLAGLSPDTPDAPDASDTVADDRVVLVRRELTTGFIPDEQDGVKQAVLLVSHTGPAPLAELLSRVDRGEANIAVLNAE